MTEPLEFRLLNPWLAALGQISGGTTSISLLSSGHSDEPPPTDLISAGLVDIEGRIPTRYVDPISCLARPDRVARLRMLSPSGTLEYHSHTSGSVSCATVTLDDGFLVRFPAEQLGVPMVLSEYTGLSTATDIEGTVDFPVQEGRVALALMDATRLWWLYNLSQEEAPGVPPISMEELIPRLTSESAQINRLESAARELQIDTPAMSEEEITGHIKSLVDRDLVTMTDDGPALGDTLQAIALPLLLISSLYRVDVVTVDSSDTFGGGRSVAVQSGPRSILVIEHGDDMIRLVGLPASEFVEMMGMVFMPDAPDLEAAEAVGDTEDLEVVEDEDRREETLTSPSFCGTCGKSLSPGTKFCGDCGGAVGK
jgi:hypothetical protein